MQGHVGPFKKWVESSRVDPCKSNVWLDTAHKPDRLAMLAGRVGRLTYIKFFFVIKSIFLKKFLYLVCNCIICINANFLFLKPRKKIFIFMFFKITKNLKY